MDLWEYKVEIIDILALFEYENYVKSHPTENYNIREHYLHIRDIGEDGWELIETKDIPIRYIPENKIGKYFPIKNIVKTNNENIVTFGIFKRKIEN